MRRRVLVTGASGLIGGRVIDLLRAECEPLALIRNAAGAPAGVESIVADFIDPKFTEKLPSKVDCLVHLAQADGFADFPDKAQSVFEINVSGFVRLLDWARVAGVSQVVHASTGGIYGLGPRAFRETDPVNFTGPLSYYFRTKRSAEILAEPYGALFGVTALRFFFVYGPNQNKTMLIPRLAESVRMGRAITLAGEHGMHINPVHVDDAAAAVVAGLQLTGSSIMNVGGPEALSIKQISDCIGSQIGRSPVFTQSGASEGKDLLGEISLMKKVLHEPTIRFRDGIRFIPPLSYE